MKDYVILTDSCCDLEETKCKELGIEYVPLIITYEGKEFSATLDWADMSAKEFYNMMRCGVHFKSAQLNIDSYSDVFEKFIKRGLDVLSLSTSSGLSGSINSSLIAKNQVLEKYPSAKIICLDCLRSSLGQGLIVMQAAALKKRGASIEEAAEWVENNRQKVHQIGTIDDMKYLKRAGRVTGAAALMGDIFRIKPLLGCNVKGQNVAYGKAIGRKASLRKCINYVKENITEPASQTAFVVHADCLDDAKKITQLLKEEVGVKDVYINYVGVSVGASVGPGMIGIYFMGGEITK